MRVGGRATKAARLNTCGIRARAGSVRCWAGILAGLQRFRVGLCWYMGRAEGKAEFSSFHHVPGCKLFEADCRTRRKFSRKPGTSLDPVFYGISTAHGKSRWLAETWNSQNFLATSAHGLGVPCWGSQSRLRTPRHILAERTSRRRASSFTVGLQSRWLYLIVFYGLPGRP